MNPLILTCLVSALVVTGLVAAERRRSTRLVWILKPLASLGFIVVAILSGAMKTPYGRTLLMALEFSWLGDVLLIPKSEKIFQWGVMAFLLGHVCFGISFIRVGLDPAALIVALILLLILQRVILKWLLPHITKKMKFPILAYVNVITLMVITAAGAARHTGNWWILAGAITFFVSDLSVARDKFVAPGFINKLWGLPVYYAAQFILAATVSSFH